MRIRPILIVSALLLAAESCPAGIVLDAQHGCATLAPHFTQITCRVATNLGSFRLDDARYGRSAGETPAHDPFGTQPWQTIEAKDARGVLDLRLSLRADDQGHWIGKIWLANRSAKPLTLGQLAIEAIRPGDWQGGRVLKFLSYENEQFTAELQEGATFGGVYATAINRPALTGAFLSNSHYLGMVSVTPVKNGLHVMAVNDSGGVTLPPGKQRESEPVWFSAGPHPSAELERWGDLAGHWNEVRIWPRNFATWCSWYSGLIQSQCEKGELEKVSLMNLPIIAEKFRALGFESTRAVDDAPDRTPGDWPLRTSSLPSGYQAMVDAMKAKRLWPGCWYDNNRVSLTSKTFQEHPDWLAMDAQRKPYILRGTGYGDFAFLDASLPAVVQKYHDDAAKFRNVGMRYCFTDFTTEALIAPSRSHDPTLTETEVSRRAQVAVRKGFGEGFYWLSQQTPASILGLADAMRTGIDSGGENKLAYGAAVGKWFMNRRLLLCDPDAWLPLSHSLQWDRDFGSWLALTGYAMTIGADFRKLTPEREQMIKRLLPPLTTTGRPRDLWERKSPVVIEQTLRAAGQQWKVVGLFNWTEVARKVRLNLDRLWDDSAYPIEGTPADPHMLGDTNHRYLIYDFWPEKLLGETDGHTECTLPPNSGRVLVCRLAEPHPQLLAVGSHLGQGVEELKAAGWDADKKELTGTTAGRRGVVDTTIRVRVPTGWKVSLVTAAGQNLPIDRPEPETCRFTVDDGKAAVDWCVKFEGRPTGPAAPFRSRNPALIAEVGVDAKAAAALRRQLPQLAAKFAGARAARVVPDGYKLVHFARPGISAAEDYDPQLGFGLLPDEVHTGYCNEAEKSKMNRYYWYSRGRVAYRIDGLDPKVRYRLGVTLYSSNVEKRGVAIGLTRARDGKQIVLANSVAEPSLAGGQQPLLAWYDIPAEIVDPQGVILEVRRLTGSNAIVAEVWLAQCQKWGHPF
jgi:hypothetical protein